MALQNFPTALRNFPNGIFLMAPPNFPDGHYETVPNAITKLPNGTTKLPNGITKLPNGITKLPNGITKLS
jgi:hypothetical protein